MADLFDRVRDALEDRYRVEREIGAGGMALVYVAEDVRHSRRVAVKVVKPELVTAVGSERFTREVQVTARLTHPNIPPLLDSGEAAGLLYYVMPFIAGPTLADRLRGGPLPIREALVLARELADALDHAHRSDVVHRDVTPGNVFLEEGHAMLGDFGIALIGLEAGAERITSTDTVIGTVEYMSPEQLTASHSVGPPSDLYSLGCVLFEMLTGEPPFLGRSRMSVIARHLSEVPPPPSALRADVPNQADEVVRRCLAKVPGDRYRTAADLRAALDLAIDAISGGTAEADLSAATASGARWLRTAAVLGIVAAVVTLVLILRPEPASAPPVHQNRVVGFPLADRGGGPDMGADAALGIGNALIHTHPLVWLDGWDFLTPVQRRDPQLITARSARTIALDRRAAHFLTGSVTRSLDSLTVRLVLHDAEADSVLDQSTAVGHEGEWTVDRLAVRAAVDLLPALVDPGRPIDLSPITDRDPGAVALWLQGDRAYRGARFAEALDLFQRAVAADSLLVYAALKGGRAAAWTEDLDLGVELIELAIRHDSVLPPRYQSYARALRAYSAGLAEEAIDHFEAALAEDGDWTEAWAGLGEVYHHLLPAVEDPIAQATRAFERALATDPEFTPPLVHLAETAYRSGDLTTARGLAERLRAVPVPSTTVGVRALALIDPCLEPPSRAGDRRPPAADVRSLLLASHQLAAGGWQFPCAEAGFRQVLERDGLSRAERWDALLGLQGILIAQGRVDELRTVLDDALRSGEGSVRFLYLLAPVAGADLGAEAAAVDSIAASNWGPDYSDPGPATTWALAVWNAHVGDRTSVNALADALLDDARARSDPHVQMLATAVTAHRDLLAGDTASALAGLQGLRSVTPRSRLDDGLSESFAVERILLADLLLERGDPASAYAQAAVFDHPQPFVFVAFLPRSLRIRYQAALALDGPVWDERAQQARERLEALGRSDLIAPLPS